MNPKKIKKLRDEAKQNLCWEIEGNKEVFASMVRLDLGFFFVDINPFRISLVSMLEIWEM